MKLNPNFTFILNVFIQNVHNVYKRKSVEEQIRQFTDEPVRLVSNPDSNRQEVEPPFAQIYSVKGFSALIYELLVSSIIPIIKNSVVSAIVK